MNILIVDDSAAIQTITRRALEREGFAGSEFRTASSGNAALELVASWFPDIIITDWHMPGISGLEMLQALQQTYEKRLLVGFVTTESVQERLQEAYHNGAAFILHKPFTDRQLGDAVRQALATRDAEAQAVEEIALATPEAPFYVNESKLLEHYLQQALKINVQLQELPNMNFDEMAVPCCIAFYGLGETGAIRGFCVLDREATALAGGRLAKLAPNDIPPTGQLQTIVSDQAIALLKHARQQMFIAPKNEPVNLLRSQLLNQIPPKLNGILAKSNGRKIFRIAAPGFKPGLLTLIAR